MLKKLLFLWLGLPFILLGDTASIVVPFNGQDRQIQLGFGKQTLKHILNPIYTTANDGSRSVSGLHFVSCEMQKGVVGGNDFSVLGIDNITAVVRSKNVSDDQAFEGVVVHDGEKWGVKSFFPCGWKPDEIISNIITILEKSSFVEAKISPSHLDRTIIITNNKANNLKLVCKQRRNAQNTYDVITVYPFLSYGQIKKMELAGNTVKNVIANQIGLRYETKKKVAPSNVDSVLPDELGNALKSLDYGFIKNMVERGEGDFAGRNANKETAYMILMGAEGDLETKEDILSLLSTQIPLDNEQLVAKDKQGRTVLYRILKGKMDDNFDLKNPTDDLSLIESYFANKKSVDDVFRDKSFVMWAVHQKSLPLVMQLVEAGADPNPKYDTRPLDRAIDIYLSKEDDRLLPIISFLTERTVAIDIEKYKKRRGSPRGGPKEALEKVVNILEDAIEGKTPLMRAIRLRSNDEALRLLEQSSVEERDSMGNGAMHYAIEAGITPVVQQLINYNIDVDAKNNAGETPWTLIQQLRYNGPEYEEIYTLVSQKKLQQNQARIEAKERKKIEEAAKKLDDERIREAALSEVEQGVLSASSKKLIERDVRDEGLIVDLIVRARSPHSLEQVYKIVLNKTKDSKYFNRILEQVNIKDASGWPLIAESLNSGDSASAVNDKNKEILIRKAIQDVKDGKDVFDEVAFLYETLPGKKQFALFEEMIKDKSIVADKMAEVTDFWKTYGKKALKLAMQNKKTSVLGKIIKQALHHGDHAQTVSIKGKDGSSKERSLLEVAIAFKLEDEATELVKKGVVVGSDALVVARNKFGEDSLVVALIEEKLALEKQGREMQKQHEEEVGRLKKEEKKKKRYEGNPLLRFVDDDNGEELRSYLAKNKPTGRQLSEAYKEALGLGVFDDDIRIFLYQEVLKATPTATSLREALKKEWNNVALDVVHSMEIKELLKDADLLEKVLNAFALKDLGINFDIIDFKRIKPATMNVLLGRYSQWTTKEQEALRRGMLEKSFGDKLIVSDEVINVITEDAPFFDNLVMQNPALAEKVLREIDEATRKAWFIDRVKGGKLQSVDKLLTSVPLSRQKAWIDEVIVDSGSFPVAEYLLRHEGISFPARGFVKGKVKQKFKDLHNEFFVFVTQGQLAELKKLLSIVDINMKKNDDVTPLMVAIINAKLEIAEFLVENGADINAKDSLGVTPLMLAALMQPRMVKFLVENGADINAENNDGVTPLMLASQKDNFETVKLLVESGADINVENKGDATALMLAAQNGHFKAAELFVEKGADVNAKDENGSTALIMALQGGHYKAAELFVENGADVNAKDKNGSTALMLASFSGKPEVVKFLIGHGADVNERDKNNFTELLLAAQNGHYKISELLIEKGADVNAKAINNVTALMTAAQNGHYKISELLIGHGADVNAKTVDGSSALRTALQNGHYKIAELLIGQGADVNAKDKNGSTILMLASYSGKLEVVKFLIGHGADVNAHNKIGETSLMLAAKNGQSEISELLIGHGADVNAKDKNGETSLMFALQNGRYKISEFLIAKGADVNAINAEGSTVLMAASYSGKFEEVKFLIGHGADVNAKDKSGFTSLMVASQNGHYKISEFLIENGADVNEKDKIDGVTALMLASQNGHFEVVKLLIEKGADVNAKDKSGFTSLMFASQYGHLKTVKHLVAKGADVNAKYKDDSTSLMVAAQDGYFDIVKFLIENGADVNAKDKNGVSVLRFARQNGHYKIAELLIENGADY